MKTNKSKSPIDIYLNQIMDSEKFPFLTEEQQIELAKRIHEGDKGARDELTCAFLRVVVGMASKYSTLGICFEDLIGEGNRGLIRAAEKYDPKKGKFLTYATDQIKHKILTEVYRNLRTVKFTRNDNSLLNRINHARAHLADKNQHDPSVREISEYLGKPANLVSRLIGCSGETASLDSLTLPKDRENCRSYAPYLQDNRENVEESAVEKMSKESVFQILDSFLKPREADILKRLFGYNGRGKETLDIVGQAYHITRERVRQIKEKALEKLRENPEANAKLKGYFR